jgi:SAM-dependent MidA family methyltransferase
VFAEILADEAAAQLEKLAAAKVPEPYFIVEMGSGNGLLAQEMSKSFRRRHPEWAGIQWALVERCENLLVESICSFSGSGEKILGFTRLADLPPCAGVFISNELVDAFPVHLLEKRDGQMWEVHVGNRKVLGKLSTPELSEYAERIQPHLPEGGRHAVNLEALSWMRQLAKTITAGSVVTIDYGHRFAAEAANEPRSFQRHSVSGDLFSTPGRKDLTTSVDFESLITEGQKVGLKTASFTSLSRFLIDRGILDRLPATKRHDPVRAYRERNQIKTLFHPDGMGEVFKVLIQEKKLAV